MKQVCTRAIEDFLDNGLRCAYVHSTLGESCANTKTGHSKGHQSSSGDHLDDGSFMSGGFNSINFLTAIEQGIATIIRELNETDADRHERARFLIERHRRTLKSTSESSFWTRSPRTSASLTADPLSDLSLFPELPRLWRNELRTSTCFSCLFGRPEYRLPCGHILCLDCVRDFDQSTEDEKYPGVVIHKECVLCYSIEPNDQWPWRIQVNTKLSGLRVLSLDGGGVQGIVELVVLKRLEAKIGLGLPVGYFFDLIVGTSAGMSRKTFSILE